MTADDVNPTGRPLRHDGFDPELTPQQFESQFWSRILERHPYYEDVLRRQSENLARASRYSELLALDRRMVELRPEDASVRYNLACTLSRLDLLDEALATLKTAIKLGYDDIEHLEADPDLDPLRELPGFRRLMSARRPRRKRM